MFLVCLFSLGIASKLVEYRLNNNYGSFIYDYSGNGRYGKIRDESNLSPKIIFTDRGFYLGSFNAIASTHKNFTIPNPCTILLWVFTDSMPGRIFHLNGYLDYHLRIFRDYNENLKIDYVYSNILISLYSDQNTFVSNQWELISVIISNTHYIVKRNGLIIKIIDIGFFISFSYWVIIGYDLQLTAANGFVWYYALIDYENADAEFIGSQYETCFLETCTNCNSLIFIDYLGKSGCISVNIDIHTDAIGNLCKSDKACRDGAIIECLCQSGSCVYESSDNFYCVHVKTNQFKKFSALCNEDGQGCCLDVCAECSNMTSCISCLDINAFVDDDGLCSCNFGYYGIRPLNSTNSCKKCPDECLECDNSNICTLCANNFSYPTIDGCICNDGYWPTGSLNSSDACKKCSDECLKCDNSSICTVCINELSYPTRDGCIICKENEEFINGLCLCNEGFSLINNLCTQNYFYMNISVSTNNRVLLNFSESPIELSISEIIISIPSISYSVKIVQKTISSYLIKLTFSETVAENTVIIVTINMPLLLSEEKSTLKEYSSEAFLYSFEFISDTYKEIISKSNSASQGIVVASFAFASVSHPSVTWALINTLQFINYIPLSENNFSPTVRHFLLGIADFNILPCLTEYIFSPNSTSQPFSAAKKLNIGTSVFWVNFGSTILILVALVILAPFLMCIKAMNFGSFSKKSANFLCNYRYTVFIRFWAQSFLDVIFFAIVQMRSDFVNYHWEYYFNFFSACIIICLAFLTLPFVIFKIIMNFDKIESEDEDFKRKYGSLFMEFKNNKGKVSSLYYALFFTRRIGFILIQIFLNFNQNLQFGFNVGLTVLTLIYLIIFRPFKVFTVAASNFISEFTILAVLIVLFTLNFELSNHTLIFLENLLVSCILFCMMLQIAISLIDSIITLRRLILNYRMKKYLVQSELS